MRLLNPVLSRELRALHRGVFLYVLRGAYVAILGALVLACWRETANIHGVLPMSDTPNIPFERIGALGRSLFELFCMAELALVMAIGPILTARLLTEERERKTLEILAACPLSNFGVAAGKFQVGFIHLVLLLIAGLPVLAITALLGGVSLHEIFLAMVYLGCLSSLAAAAGLVASSLCARTSAAVLASYAVLGVVLLILEAPAYVVEQQPDGKQLGAWVALAQAFGPVQNLMATLGPGSNAALIPDTGPAAVPSWVVTLSVTLASTLLLLAGVAARIRRDWSPGRSLTGSVSGTWRALSRPLTPKLLWRLLDWINPFFGRHWREQSAFVAATILVLAGILCAGWLAEALALAMPARWRLPFLADGFPAAGLAAMGLTSVMAAAALAKERDRLTLELTQVAPDGPRRLLAALLLTPVAQLTLFVCVGAGLSVAIVSHSLTALEPVGVIVLWATAWVLGTAMVCVGVGASLLLRSATRAMVGTLLFLVGLCLAPWIAHLLGQFIPQLARPSAAGIATLLSPYESLQLALRWPSETPVELPISLMAQLAGCAALLRLMMIFRGPLLRRHLRGR